MTCCLSYARRQRCCRAFRRWWLALWALIREFQCLRYLLKQRDLLHRKLDLHRLLLRNLFQNSVTVRDLRKARHREFGFFHFVRPFRWLWWCRSSHCPTIAGGHPLHVFPPCGRGTPRWRPRWGLLHSPCNWRGRRRFFLSCDGVCACPHRLFFASKRHYDALRRSRSGSQRRGSE